MACAARTQALAEVQKASGLFYCPASLSPEMIASARMGKEWVQSAGTKGSCSLFSLHSISHGLSLCTPADFNGPMILAILPACAHVPDTYRQGNPLGGDRSIPRSA
jgi:hypothetical protein